MKIVLFDNVGDLGIVIGWKRVISENNFVFEVDREGELRVGDKVYPVYDGRAYVPQYNIVLGEPRKITFVDKQGRAFSCGVISRTGSHLINIACELETCLIACVEKIASQDEEIKRLNEEISKLKNEYGVSFE